ncbi:hypothetical protein BHQ18_09345 [Mycolicibacterium flavescens]|uniref:Transmembrane protein n=1 Tax=Mycolicibacterium flavescens TaxID=1776 RepID=A0A1E3RN99_MYCFV|nr:hypothetical protein BHQ18_09345 [Mycolicibacterium flavescens]
MSASAATSGQSTVWRIATWAAPVLTQLILGFVLAVAWLVGKWLPGTSGLVLFLIGAGVTFLVSAAVSSLLIRSAAARERGLAYAVLGSYAVVLIGGAIYGFWILQW